MWFGHIVWFGISFYLWITAYLSNPCFPKWVFVKVRCSHSGTPVFHEALLLPLSFGHVAWLMPLSFEHGRFATVIWTRGLVFAGMAHLKLNFLVSINKYLSGPFQVSSRVFWGLPKCKLHNILSVTLKPSPRSICCRSTSVLTLLWPLCYSGTVDGDLGFHLITWSLRFCCPGLKPVWMPCTLYTQPQDCWTNLFSFVICR